MNAMEGYGGPGPFELTPVVYQLSHEPGAWYGYIQLEVPPLNRRVPAKARASAVTRTAITWNSAHLTPPAGPRKDSPRGAPWKVSTFEVGNPLYISFTYDPMAFAASEIIVELENRECDRVTLIPCQAHGSCVPCGKLPHP